MAEIDQCFLNTPNDLVWNCILPHFETEHLQKLLEDSKSTNDTGFTYKLLRLTMPIKCHNSLLQENDIKPFVLYAMQHFNVYDLCSFLNSIAFPTLCSCIDPTCYWEVLFERDDFEDLFDSVVNGCKHCLSSAIDAAITLNNTKRFLKLIVNNVFITVEHILKAICEACVIKRKNDKDNIELVIDLIIDTIRQSEMVRTNLCFDMVVYAGMIESSSIYSHEIYDDPVDNVFSLMFDAYLMLNSKNDYNAKIMSTVSNKYLKKVQRALQDTTFNFKAIVKEYGMMHDHYYEYWYNEDEYDDEYFD
jgi:hypothetical protein